MKQENNTFKNFFNERMNKYYKDIKSIQTLYSISENLLDNELLEKFIKNFDSLIKEIKRNLYEDMNIHIDNMNEDNISEIVNITNDTDIDIIPDNFINNKNFKLLMEKLVEL